MKNVVILGSTGSLGIQTLKILQKYSKNFRIIGLSAHSSKKLLLKQAQKFRVPNIVLATKDGEKNIHKLASLKRTDIVVNVISGIAGIKPSLAALKAGKILILGNKESIVAEGKKILKLIPKSSAKTNQPFTQILGSASDGPYIIPLDSEHNAIYEVIQKVYANAISKNLPPPEITRIFLPCSGGPFLGKTQKELKKITIKEALNHPKWKMGSKISIESAILLNKGLEIIEAHHLFQIPLNKIKVFLHPQCLIHGIVEFKFTNFPKTIINTPHIISASPVIPASAGISRKKDLTTFTQKIAYYGKPDMREHIENALLRSANLPLPKRKVKIFKNHSHEFQKPNHRTFSGIKLVLSTYKNHHAQMKKFLKREEETINNFLTGKIKFVEIMKNLKT